MVQRIGEAADPIKQVADTIKDVTKVLYDAASSVTEALQNQEKVEIAREMEVT